MILLRKILKTIYNIFFKLVLNIIITQFINKNKLLHTNRTICVPSVNTIGDAIIYYDYVKHKIKKPLVVSPCDFPSDDIIPFFFKKSEYIFFNSFFFDFLKNLNNYNKKNLNHFALQILENKLNKFKYYKPYRKSIKNLENTSISKELIKLRKYDNKFFSLRDHYKFKNYSNNKLNNFKGYNDIEEKKILSSFNLKKNRFICLHIRPYPKDKKLSYKKKFETNPRSIHNIKSYNLSLRYLIKKNFKIILMGNRENTINLKINHKNIIHYYKHFKQNIINDLYLVNNCFFYIGCQSGPSVVPSILNKPILHVNYASFFGIFPSKISLYLPKKFIYLGKEISLKKYFQSKYFFLENSNDFNTHKIRLVDNNETEILKAMIELFRKIKKNTKTLRQKKFLKLLNKTHLLSYDTKILISDYYLKKYF